ncbi:MAG: phosphoribosylformylglycinamidine synthase subunit PurL [Elusimicrobia bacterium]|nr:phosphoribosylformylglycinamidine synthase subunit PurL [Candidatus Liberimonas magnetica]
MVKIIEIMNSSDEKLIKISKDYILSLSLVEMKAIQGYFKKLRRNPTDVELETLAQTWSEHCKHKTLAGIVEYEEIKPHTKAHGQQAANQKSKTTDCMPSKKVYNNLLKETVFKVTKELNKKWCISVFKDNAGIIEFDKNNGVAFKVETHNHPSALEPYGGAATGIGGVIRDILGVGLGAKPLANTDVFCFGLPGLPWKDLPQGVLHPKRIAKGVVSGVRDYGNRMGIPTINGAVYFDEGYTSNPLVFCGTLGIIPKNKCFKKVYPGDLILVVGGKTGRDGIHGATFSSVQLDQESDVSAVQIGNPIIEKKVLDTVLKARDMNLYHAITDCGAGGLSSAVGELGQDCGALVHLEKVSLKYEGLKPWEIWISEAQERMVLSVPKKNKGDIEKVFLSEDVEATFIGEFTNDKILTVMYEKDVVAKLHMEFLHNGVPRQKRKAVWEKRVESSELRVQSSKNLGKDLNQLLSSYNICSKEWIIRQYDHEVQGQTVVKPLHGKIENTGPGDASVIWPYTITGESRYRGIVISNGLNPEYGKIDPYWMAASSIDEAIRNAVCVGGQLEKIAILDNFCWGNPNRPEQLAGVVRAAQACYDIAKIYGTPFISGKDSLHNEYALKDKLYSIPPALLISAVGIVDDIRKTITMDLKEEGSLIYVLGETKNEMGGSHYFKIHNLLGGSVPRLDALRSKRLLRALQNAINKSLVSSCHDCSEGGIGVALAEMSIAGNRGIEFDLTDIPEETKLGETGLLFSESNSRFIVEVNPKNKKLFEKTLAGLPFKHAGKVTKEATLTIKDLKGKTLIEEKINTLRDSWQKTLSW